MIVEFHVGEEQLLAPADTGLDDEVDRHAGEFGGEQLPRPGIRQVGVEPVVEDVAGAAGGEPVGRAEPRAELVQPVAQRRHGGPERRRGVVGGDEGKDGVRHARVIGEPVGKGKRVLEPRR